MMNNLGFRINKYLKVSLTIGILDLLIFYIAGKIFNNLEIFNLIIQNWKYISLFIATNLILIYFSDVLFFYKRNRKYKFLCIFTEPFKDWKHYIDKTIKIEKKDTKVDFYSSIYCKVKNTEKIKGIMNDEVFIRDLITHLISTNVIILLFYFLLEIFNLKVYLFCLLVLLTIYLLLNLLYRNYLKYYISEIYVEYKNSKF